ncbi:MAG: hypothetical protein D6762_06190 [Candidatus Neomarinimicrobiota bacterium]|nr:MAG: hypothetical protein D6762_06190 [Candidatus Neomarinimicrobiota bacterium]
MKEKHASSLPVQSADDGRNPLRAVVALHGDTGNRYSMKPVSVGCRCRGTRWYFPEAPFELESAGQHTWWQKSSGPIDFRPAFTVLDTTLEQVVRDGIPRQRTVLLGFSQGACLTLEYGLRTDSLGGLVAIAGFLTDKERLAREQNPASRQTPILILHGTRDKIVPPEQGRATRDQLMGWGYEVQWSSYAAGHKIPLPAMNTIRQFLQVL